MRLSLTQDQGVGQQGESGLPPVCGEQLAYELQGVEGAPLSLVLAARGQPQPRRCVSAPPDQLLRLLICTKQQTIVSPAAFLQALDTRANAIFANT